MSQIAGLQDFRGQSPPADIGTHLLVKGIFVFQHTFSGVTRFCAVRSGERGWVLVSFGTVAATVINAAILATGGNNEVAIGYGTYVLNTPVISQGLDGVKLSGMGRGTILQVAANTAIDAIEIGIDGGAGQTGWVIEQLTVDGNRGNNAAGGDIRIQNGIIFNNSPDCAIRYCWVHDCIYDGTLPRDNSDRALMEGNIVWNCGYGGICAWRCYGVKIIGNTCHSNGILTGSGIVIEDLNYTICFGNVCYQGAGNGIEMWGQDAYRTYGNVIIGNICYDNALSGINISNWTYDYTIVGNSCNANHNNGINITGNNYQGTVSANVCYLNTWSGINISDGATLIWVVNNIFVSNGANGINFESNADSNFADGNICTLNGWYGIDIAAGCDYNKIGANNYLLGNTTAAFRDLSGTAILPTLTLPFVNGTLFLSADGAPWGWEIDAATEYAIALGHIPNEAQQVVRWKIWAVGLAAPGPGNTMALEIVGRGGASDEAYTTESVDVANKASNETNFAINDIISWTLTPADDADIGHYLGGDAIMIKVLYESAGGLLVATDAAFLCVEIQYV